MPDPPRDIGPIPDGSSADVHLDRDDPVIQNEATETQPSSDEESKETELPETGKTPEAKLADATQAAQTGTSKGLEDENAEAAAAETGKTPEAKLADATQAAQTGTSKGLEDENAKAAAAETGKTPEAKLADATQAAQTDTSKELKDEKAEAATAKAATETANRAEEKLSGKENAPDAKGGQPPIISKNPPPGWPAIDCSQSSAELEKKLTDCMTALYGETLVHDVDGAQMLLSFVTRNGLQEDKKVDNTTIQKLVETRERMRAGTFDAEKEEVDFRKSYGIIAKAADPVNVVSLRESTDKQWRRPWHALWTKQLNSTAGNACLKYRNFAFLVLIALLICQIYWTILSSVLNKTDALSEEINRAPTNAEYDQLEAARQKTATVTNQPETNKPGPPPTGPAPASPAPTSAPKLTLEERNAKTAERDANFLTLRGLVNPMASVFFRQVLPALFPPAGKDKLPPSGPPVKPEPSAKPSGPPVPPPDKDQSNPLKEEPVKNDGARFIPTDIQNQRATVRAVALQVIDVMQKWVLPLLYGMLGAMVFVVRTLSMQARDRLFRKEALVILSLRIYLGMISGLAIGWFWTASPPVSSAAGAVSITTLSPFALAFVAGYGVELFFSLLDKILSAFSNKA
jgi:hypothetical protein